MREIINCITNYCIDILVYLSKVVTTGSLRMTQ